MQQTKENFKPNYKQQLAIDFIDGAVMLLAGPGTGKTYTLTKRVEKMLELGIKPEAILCLTFSDAATSEMQTRFINKIGPEASGVNVSTYHSFCIDIIKRFPEVFEFSDNIQMADDVTKQAILKECIDEFDQKEGINFLKDKWGNKYFYIGNILDSIEVLKRERTTKEEYFENLKYDDNWGEKLRNLYLEKKEREEKNKVTKKILNDIETLEKKIGKATELYSIYEIYKRKLSENNLIDFADMVNLVVEKFETDDDFLFRALKGVEYILVDEYQDTSKIQNELLFNILRGTKKENIFVVGDDDQIIYSFQGARSSNLADFLEKFPNTSVISLNENRRSTQTILDFSDLLISEDKFRLKSHNNEPIDKKLIAKNDEVIKKEEKIKLNVFQETVQEDNFIIEEIEKLIKKGEKLSEISIICKKNDKLEEYGRLLKQKNIPFVLSRAKNALLIPSFIIFYSYLKILENIYIEQDKLFALLTNEPFKFSDEIIAKILYKQRTTNKNWHEILQDENNEEFKNSVNVQEFLKIYNELKLRKSYLPLMPFLYEVLAKTGILKYFSNLEDETKFENIQAIQRLIDEAKSFLILHSNASLNEFINHLDTYIKQGIGIKLKKDEYKKEAIQLVTFHGSKGREFEYVFIPNLTTKNFEGATAGNEKLQIPVKKSLFSQDKDENNDAENLRLLFVGITRAKFGLYLSYSNATNGNTQAASKYIANIFPNANIYVEQKFYEIDMDSKINETIKNLTVEFSENSYKKEIQDRVNEIVLSQSSLNEYLACPLSYFYSNILKVPVYVEDKDILSYGSSMHFAIDFMTKSAIKNGFWGEACDMINKFREKINNIEFTTPEKREEYEKRGIKAINDNFLKLIEANPKNILKTEYKMELDFEGTILKGFADRISKDNEGNIYITDFKTGSYKKAKEGTKYYNQLRFYKFLYEELNPNSKVAETALVFVEENFATSKPTDDITKNEEIKEIIRNAVKNIKNLNFEPVKNKDNCKFCNYKLICNLYNKN